VLAKVDFAAFVHQLGRTNYLGFLAFAAVSTLLLLLADCSATVEIYRRTICPVSFQSFFTVRAASYLPSLLNYQVGQAWLTYFMAKFHRAPLWRVAGATLLSFATTLGCLLLFGILAVPLNEGRLPWLAPVVIVGSVLAVLYIAVIAMKPRFLRSWQTSAALVDMGVRGHLIAFVHRIPHALVLFVMTWVPFWFFGVRIPLHQALALLPPIMLVAGLPISPQGVGTRDILVMQLLSAYAPGTPEEGRATIAAASLSWAVALTLVQLVIAGIFMSRARKLLAGSIAG
jgi:hypothetical protein